MKPTKKLFSEQFRACNIDGTCQHMDKDKYLSMSRKQKKHYEKQRVFFKFPPGYWGPRGPLFCGKSPGVCSSSHCPLLKS